MVKRLSLKCRWAMDVDDPIPIIDKDGKKRSSPERDKEGRRKKRKKK